MVKMDNQDLEVKQVHQEPRVSRDVQGCLGQQVQQVPVDQEVNPEHKVHKVTLVNQAQEVRMGHLVHKGNREKEVRVVYQDQEEPLVSQDHLVHAVK